MVGPIDSLSPDAPEAEWHQTLDLGGEERSEEESILSDTPCVPPSGLKDKVKSLFPTHPVLGLEVTVKHLDEWLSMKQKEDVSSMIASGNFIRFKYFELMLGWF